MLRNSAPIKPPPPAAAPVRTRIRGARPGDLDAIDAIETRSFDKDRFPRRNLARVMKSPATAFLLAESGGRPAGYLMLLFRRGSRVARLYSLAVDPDFRGRGIADSLLGAAGAAAAERGADRLRLEFRPSNLAAQRLYERAGFTLLERKPGYYDDGEDAIRMEKRLAPNASGDRSAHP